GRSKKYLKRDLYYDLRRNNTLGLYREFLAEVAQFPSVCTLCRSKDLGPILHGDALMGWRRRAAVGAEIFQDPLDADLPFPFARVDLSGQAIAPARGACPNWTAGETSYICRASSKLDVKGFFIVACRHGFIWSCSDVRTPGERLIYPTTLLRAAVQRLGVQEESVTFVYDVACKIGSKVKSKLAVPVFHAYGHESKCRLNNSIRVTSGTGITDGEICERIFSFLRPYGRILKEMRIDRRTRLIAHIIGMYHLRLDFDFTYQQLLQLGEQWLREDAHAATQRTSDWLQKMRRLAVEKRQALNALNRCIGSHQSRLLTRKVDVLRTEMKKVLESSGSQYTLKELENASSAIYSRLDNHTIRPFPLAVQLAAIEIFTTSIRSTEEVQRVNAERDSLARFNSFRLPITEVCSNKSSDCSGSSSSEDELD
uniref:DDE Tnp4 domain-containing protein n=1 Tax=Macrostomum lignano TaxID=282301 RepID=A0A1I8G5M5_9PLAT